MDPIARLEVDDGVGVVRLDRPPANAIDLQMGLDLQVAIAEGVERDDVGALVIWGGPKIFAAGADIKAMADWGPDEVRPSVDALGAACDLLEAAPTISIAAINGYALGGGMELALAADLRLVAEDARLGQPEIRLGVIPGAGGTQRLSRLLGPGRAAEFVYTGREVGPRKPSPRSCLSDRACPGSPGSRGQRRRAFAERPSPRTCCREGRHRRGVIGTRSRRNRARTCASSSLSSADAISARGCAHHRETGPRGSATPHRNEPASPVVRS